MALEGLGRYDPGLSSLAYKKGYSGKFRTEWRSVHNIIHREFIAER